MTTPFAGPAPYEPPCDTPTDIKAATSQRSGAATGTGALAIAAGEVVRMQMRSDARQGYYLYVPRNLEKAAPVFVTVHGISRNAKEHAERFAPFAERYGVVVVAPRFGRKRFPRYQCLTADRHGHRPDAVLDDIVAEVRRALGLADSGLYLFGFSGGGQFVHRYLMAKPAKVERAVVGAAGWYTFPDVRKRYPRGTRVREGRSPELDPAYLRVPIAVVVGDGDVERNAALNQSPRIDRQQGATRLERGRNWVMAMRRAARAEGLDTPYRFQALAGVEHNFGSAMSRGRMGEAVFAFLFGEKQEAFAAPGRVPEL